MQLETRDLILRESEFTDLDTFFEWETRPEVTEFFSISSGQTKEDVYRKFFTDRDDPGARQFTIWKKPSAGDKTASPACADEAEAVAAAGEPVRVGRIVLADVIPGWKGEVWRIYIADPALRNRGYGGQALTAVLRYMFGELAMERVYLDFYTGNPAEYLYRKLGFTEEGVLRKNCRKDDVLHDVHLMSMLREEFEARFTAGQ